MNTRPIRTEADYDAALAEIERLWGAKPGAPGGDRLDVLLVLVESRRAGRGVSVAVGHDAPPAT